MYVCERAMDPICHDGMEEYIRKPFSAVLPVYQPLQIQACLHLLFSTLLHNMINVLLLVLPVVTAEIGKFYHANTYYESRGPISTVRVCRRLENSKKEECKTINFSALDCISLDFTKAQWNNRYVNRQVSVLRNPLRT